MLSPFETIARGYLLARKSELQARISPEPLTVERYADAVEEIVADAQRKQAAIDLERDTKMLHAVEDALRRLEDGSYGVCGECGEKIAPKRLTAVPWAALCLQCQELAEAEMGRVAA